MCEIIYKQSPFFVLKFLVCFFVAEYVYIVQIYVKVIFISIEIFIMFFTVVEYVYIVNIYVKIIFISILFCISNSLISTFIQYQKCNLFKVCNII